MNTDHLRCQYCDVGLFSPHEPEALSHLDCEICNHPLIDDVQSLKSILWPDNIPKEFGFGPNWSSFGILCMHFNDSGFRHYEKLLVELKRVEEIDIHQSANFGIQTNTTDSASPLWLASTHSFFSMLEKFIWDNELGIDIQISYFIFEGMDQIRTIPGTGQYLLDKAKTMRSSQTVS